MLTRGTQTLIWDIDNRVTSVSILGGGTTSMQYDYTGMRVKKDAPTGVTLFQFKGYEVAPDGTITKFIRIGVETLASKKRTTGGATTQFFYHNDHLGGVNVITDGSGARCQLNEYDPWGGDSRSEGPTPGTPATCDPTHRFTGQELDPESGLYYYGGRYYDQEISRFISPDPYIQEPDNPQNLNRYTYVLNNPQGYIDPTGFGFWDDLFDFFFGSFSSDSEDGDTSTSSSGGVGGIIGALITLFSSLDSEVVNKAELRREALKQKPNIFNQLALTSQTKVTNPNTGSNPGYDYPDEVPAATGARAGAWMDYEGFPQRGLNPYLGKSLADRIRERFGDKPPYGGRGVRPLQIDKANSVPQRTAPKVDQLSPKIQRQLEQRGWTKDQIKQAVEMGEDFPAVNRLGGANTPATRYINPQTGASVVIDNATGEVIHVGKPGFRY